MTVIGCVWGAHRKLADTLGDDAPDYEWCEAEFERIRHRAPAPAALPSWLYMELFFNWRRETVQPRERQLSLFGGAA